MATDSPFRPDVVRGKAALVTGGGSGICFEIAAQLARHGASVAIMGRRREVLDKAVAALRSEGLRVRAPRLICSPPFFLSNHTYHCYACFYLGPLA
jgi:NAD(P)-dependent dehydrogenase (short-subunit alcohol dehydrogenase family)